MRTLLGISILLILPFQTPTDEKKPLVASGSPVGLKYDAFKKLYPTSRCFYADDKQAETVQFCVVEPSEGSKILLFDRFSVTREVATFNDAKVVWITARLDEKTMNVRKYLDEAIPKSDPVRDCMERADRIAKYEADFHTKGIPEPDRAHYQDELREATLAYDAIGCGIVSAETLTSWRYRGEQIIVTYRDENITEMKILGL
jgi:hypothetical protein